MEFPVKKILLGLLTAICLSNGVVLAQDKKEAFEEIRVVFNYQQNTNQNYFHDYWSGKDAFGIDLETPFYAGDFFISGRYASFSKRTEQVPSFDNYQINVGWGMKYEIIPDLRIGASVGGLFSMYYFEELTEEQVIWVKGHLGTISPENESGFIFNTQISYDFAENWGIKLSANRNIIYTKEKIKLNYVGVGIYRTFQTPNWLKEILE